MSAFAATHVSQRVLRGVRKRSTLQRCEAATHLSAAALVELCGVDERYRKALLTGHRRWSETIALPDAGAATLRDQAPLNPAKLDRCLADGMTVPEWLTMLNSVVFFWPTVARVAGSLKAYAEENHDVIVVDTRRLVSRHVNEIRLSHMNTGSTSPMAFARGANTFRRINDYPLSERSRRKSSAVAEVVVPVGISDVAEVAARVERWSGDQRGEVI